MPTKNMIGAPIEQAHTNVDHPPDWSAREVFVSGLDALGLRGTARGMRRFVDLAATGTKAQWSQRVRRNRRSPRVAQSVSDVRLPSPQGHQPDDLGARNEKLAAILDRYRQHPDFARLVSPYWKETRTDDELTNFRRHGSFLWTHEPPYRYRASARYLRKRDLLNLLSLFGEDGAFGCETLQLDGVTLSRDKIDSALEIYFLREALGLGVFDSLNVLDIGAGYGRFAHRFTTVFRNAEVTCIDVIPMSTYLCDLYLKYRQVRRAAVVAFDELHTLEGRRFDFAVSIHSLPEQTSESIEYWLDLLASLDIRTFVVVDHNGEWLTMEQPDNRRGCYFPLFERRGWTLIASRPKYEGFFANLFGIYPEAVYAMFVRG